MQKKDKKLIIKLKFQFPNNMFMRLLMLVGTIILFSGISLFWIGFHNVDLGRNVDIINERHNLSYRDINSNGIYWTATEMYVKGLEQLTEGLKFALIGSFFFGLGLLYDRGIK